MSKNRYLIVSLNYRLKNFAKPALIYLSIFAFADLVLPLLLSLIFRGKGVNFGFFDYDFSGTSGIVRTLASMPFMIGTAIFLFVAAVSSFSEDFNLLLTLNCTRRNQFLSEMIMMLLAGGSAVVCSAVIRTLEILGEAIVKRVNVIELFDYYRFLYLRYGSINLGRFVSGQIVNELLLGFAVFILAYSLGYAAGVLIYRFGAAFAIPFWICFGASFIFMPMGIWGVMINEFGLWFIGAGRSVRALTFDLVLLFISAALIVIGGFGIRKLQQNR